MFSDLKFHILAITEKVWCHKYPGNLYVPFKSNITLRTNNIPSLKKNNKKYMHIFQFSSHCYTFCSVKLLAYYKLQLDPAAIINHLWRIRMQKQFSLTWYLSKRISKELLQSEVKQAVFSIRDMQLSSSRSLTHSFTLTACHCGSRWKAVHL